MGPAAEVLLPNNEKLRIKFRVNPKGTEVYWVNDEIVLEVESRGCGTTNTRIIPHKDLDIKLKYSYDGLRLLGSIYINGQLYKDDVFKMKDLDHKPIIYLSWAVRALLVMALLLIVWNIFL